VRASVAMLARLQAEEALAAVDAHALGTGSFAKEDASRMLARLEQTAAGAREEPQAKRPPDPAELAAMGIAVILRPVEKALNDG
jgi:hypothetical protein